MEGAEDIMYLEEEMEQLYKIINKRLYNNDLPVPYFRMHNARYRKKGWNIQYKQNKVCQIDINQKSLDTTLKLYGTIQSVQNVSNIKEMSFLDYQIRRLDDSIQFYNKEIGKNAKSIATLTEKYNHMSTTIADLNSQKQYMTEEEISDTDQTIASTQSDQKEIQNQIDALKADNEEYTQRIEKTQAQITDLKKGEKNYE